MYEDPNSEKSEYELLRERNIREREAYFASFDDDDEFKEMMKDMKDLCESKPPSKPVKRRQKSTADRSCRFSVRIPVERRWSSRLANQPAQHYDDGVLDEVERRPKRASQIVDNIEDLERIAFRPRKIQNSSKTTLALIIPVEEITEEDLANISKNASKKVYSKVGTTCHQCRQKTLDTKTVCRSGKCVGINGQFCGPCLKNRYGEDVAVALKDPKWECPYCLGQCNCSLCRAHAGKRPTGILAPLAFQKGFGSVHHMLENLNGYGDFVDKSTDGAKDKELLGFDISGEPAMN